MLNKNFVVRFDRVHRYNEPSLWVVFEVKTTYRDILEIHVTYNKEGKILTCTENFDLQNSKFNPYTRIECAEVYKKILRSEGDKIVKVIDRAYKLQMNYDKKIANCKSKITSYSELESKVKELELEYFNKLKTISIR